MPVASSAGYILMFRHLFELNKKNSVSIITDDNPRLRNLEMPSKGIRLHDQSRNIIRRIFAKIGQESIWILLESKRLGHTIEKIIKNNKPDLILTVWHSHFLLAAATVANRAKIPLATVIHDDWEQMVNWQGIGKKLLQSRLKKIFLQSNARICVSKGMADKMIRQYGKKPCEIVYPIPSHFNNKRNRKWSNKKNFKIGFFGSLFGNVEVLLSVAKAIEGLPFNLTFFSHSQGPERKKLSIQKNVKDGGVLSSKKLKQFFVEKIDLVLIPQSFSKKHKENVKTSFPSKLIEACQFKLPIVIIGPKYGEAQRWGKKYLTSKSLCFSLEKSKIIKLLQENLNEIGWKNNQKKVINASRIFSANKIQNKFEKVIKKLNY